MGIRNRCMVCGKVFPEGQGVALRVGDEVIHFHSNRCAIKFLKIVIEELNPDEVKNAIEKAKELFNDMLRKRAEVTQKRI